MYKVKFLYRWRETNIFQVYYSICKGLNYFFPSMTLEKIYQMTREKLYLSPLLKNGHSQMTFRNETEDGEILSALCKYCSEVKYNGFMREARSRNIKGSALKSIVFFEKMLYTFIKVHLPSM